MLALCPEIKPCTKCGIEKDISSFSRDPSHFNGVKSRCKECIRTRRQERLSVNPANELYERAKRRASVQGIPFTITLSDVEVPENCPILGIPIYVGRGRGPKSHSPSLDKRIPSLGYVKGNIQVISSKANTMKSDASCEELLRFANWALENIKTHEEAPEGSQCQTR